MSWWNKFFFVLDEFFNVLLSGLFNRALGTVASAHRYGEVNKTISAITGYNQNLNKRTKAFAKFVNLIMRNPNHCELQAKEEGLL